jgi:predicted extracellular nuclease
MSITAVFARLRVSLGALVVVLLVLLVQPAGAVSSSLVLSQVYGGGGNSGAQYTNDYIEIFNRGSSSASTAGWSLQYASATGTGNFGSSATQITELPSITVAPGQYVLVQEAAGAATVAPLPTPDHIDPDPIAMGATGGKVALVLTTTPLGCNGSSTPCSPAALATIVDLVGYGNANFFEGSGPTPAPSNTTAAFRNGGGCVETDNNASDFSVAAPGPRNTASPTNTCGDNAPAVSSTNPANGAISVPVSSNVTIDFTEAVDVAGAWYSISCATSGTHTATVSGGPQSFTLDPDTDYAQGELCTITVVAAQVTDQDAVDPPDNMASDHVFSFTTFAPPPDISEIQGAAHISPKNGQGVADVEGVVTARRTAGGRGFWIQDPTPDADDATSDAVSFVNAAARGPDRRPRPGRRRSRVSPGGDPTTSRSRRS